MTRKLFTFAAGLALAVAGLFAVSPAIRVNAQAIAGQFLTNGQTLIGSTGAAPVAAALTGTANQIQVTNGAGSITLALPTAFIPQLAIYTTTYVQANAIPVGYFSLQESVAGVLVTNVYNLAYSSANVQASCVIVSVATAAIKSNPPVAGGNCSN